MDHTELRQRETTAPSQPRSGDERSLRRASVIGLGHALPARVIPNTLIARRLGVDEEWIVRRTGIRARRRASSEEGTAKLATQAGRRALAVAGLPGNAVDLVLVATVTPDDPLPNTAPLVAHALGADDAGAMDIGAACTGWLSALAVAAGHIEAQRARVALVIGADRLSSMIDPDDPKTAALFGDGAGAVVVGADGAGSVGPVLLAADGGLAGHIVAPRADGVIRMDGRATFTAAVSRLAEATIAACCRAGRALADIDLFVYHQANGRILRAVAQRLGLASERVADYIDHTGNTSAASIPLTLSLARADGRIGEGDQVLVAAVGAGLTWGAGVIEWGGC
jgi:3-oxoacyl-[acyl-carrier-protein] synthase-3